MKAVILAAGLGRSLYPLTKDRPKSLLAIKGETLLERLLGQTARYGASPVVVVGYKKAAILDAVRRAQTVLRAHIEIIENPLYERTNTLYSLSLAHDACRGEEVTVVDGDVICDDEIMEAVMTGSGEGLLAIDRPRVMGDEEIKVRLDADGRVLEIGKGVSPTSAHGEFIGLAKYSASTAEQLFKVVHEIAATGDRAAYYEDALAQLARSGVLRGVDVAGRRWVEIDFLVDYVEALRLFGDVERANALAAMPALRRQILFCPGPVLVSGRVKRALAAPEIGHREVEFSEVLNRVRLKLGRVFGVQNFHRYTTVVLNGSGSAANEALLGSAGVGQRLLILVNGEFGERLTRIADRLGLKWQALSFRWGQPIDLTAVEAALSGGDLDVLAWVHHETSTGMLNPLVELAALARRHHVETFVDAVSSLGGIPVDVEANGITFCTASANKAIGGVPGLAFVCGRREAFEALVTAPARSLYLDLHNHFAYNDRLFQTPNTPAVNLYFALDAALDEVLAGGLEHRFAHYRRLARRLRRGLRRLGLRFFILEVQMSPLLTTVELPVGFSAAEFHDRLKAAGYIVYPGKGILQERVFQVANMGAMTARHVDRFLDALRTVIQADTTPARGEELE